MTGLEGLKCGPFVGDARGRLWKAKDNSTLNAAIAKKPVITTAPFLTTRARKNHFPERPTPSFFALLNANLKRARWSSGAGHQAARRLRRGKPGQPK